MRRLAIALQQIDAQIDRRRLVHRGVFGFRRRAEGRAQFGLDPVGDVEAHRDRLLGMVERVAGQLAQHAPLVALERQRAELAAVEQARDMVVRQAFVQRQIGRHQAAAGGLARAVGALQPPFELGAAAQHAIDAFGHVAPVAAADIAAGAEEGADDGVGRFSRIGENVVEQIDGGLQSAPGVMLALMPQLAAMVARSGALR